MTRAVILVARVCQPRKAGLRRGNKQSQAAVLRRGVCLTHTTRGRGVLCILLAHGPRVDGSVILTGTEMKNHVLALKIPAPAPRVTHRFCLYFTVHVKPRGHAPRQRVRGSAVPGGMAWTPASVRHGFHTVAVTTRLSLRESLAGCPSPLPPPPALGGFSCWLPSPFKNIPF